MLSRCTQSRRHIACTYAHSLPHMSPLLLQFFSFFPLCLCDVSCFALVLHCFTTEKIKLTFVKQTHTKKEEKKNYEEDKRNTFQCSSGLKKLTARAPGLEVEVLATVRWTLNQEKGDRESLWWRLLTQHAAKIIGLDCLITLTRTRHPTPAILQRSWRCAMGERQQTWPSLTINTGAKVKFQW